MVELEIQTAETRHEFIDAIGQELQQEERKMEMYQAKILHVWRSMVDPLIQQSVRET